jgi:hypothetical protein
MPIGETTQTRALYGADDVGLFEVVPLEKERLASEFGEGICEAVTEIEPCRVPALAEVVSGLAREMRLLNRHRFDHNANAAKQCVALLGDLNAELTLDDDREFDEIPGGYTAARCAADGLDIEFRIRLFRQDGDDRCAVKDHLGRPCSSYSNSAGSPKYWQG